MPYPEQLEEMVKGMIAIHEICEKTGNDCCFDWEVFEDSITKAFQLGIEASEKCVPEKKEHDFVLPEDSVTAISISAFNACRSKTLQALAQLKGKEPKL